MVCCHIINTSVRHTDFLILCKLIKSYESEKKSIDVERVIEGETHVSPS